MQRTMRGTGHAVIDAGPPIHLSEIHGLHLLKHFDTLHMPDAVWKEVVEAERVSAQEMGMLGNIQRHTVPHLSMQQYVQENACEHLHLGESECIFLCPQIKTFILLTDDLAVRTAAKQIGLTPVESLSIVVRAYRMGDISLETAEKYLRDLYNVSSLFVTRAIVDIAIEQLRKTAQH